MFVTSQFKDIANQFIRLKKLDFEVCVSAVEYLIDFCGSVFFLITKIENLLLARRNPIVYGFLLRHVFMVLNTFKFVSESTTLEQDMTRT